MANRFTNPRPQFLDASGSPILDGELYFYENNSTVLKDTYKDANKTILNTNPVPLDADGSTPNIFYDGTARVILVTGTGQRFDVDSVGDAGSGTSFDIWNNVTEYSDGSIVEASDGEYYRSLQNNNTSNDPTSSPTFWELISFIRDWNANITYALGDGAVQGSDGKLYRSLQNSNLNNDPTVSPAWWGVNNPFDQSLNTTDSPTFADVTVDTLLPTSGTSAGDAAAVGYDALNGVRLAGQGSTNDVVLLNDLDQIAASVPTGTQILDVSYGGIYLGGTTAANLLDYYLETTFTPTATNISGTNTYSGTATRIGDRYFFEVTITTADTIASTAGTGFLTLPFTAVQDSCCMAANRITTLGYGTGLVAGTNAWPPTLNPAAGQSVVVSGSLGI